MPEFQLTHVALVGARMSAFHSFGFRTRDELALRRICPGTGAAPLHGLSRPQLESVFVDQLPVWVHNIVVDLTFPQREQLLLPLRRFEGELRDHKNDQVISAVLSAGFRNQALDPLDLPDSMPMRQRCLMVMQVGVWQEAYRQLQQDLLRLLTACAPQIDHWLEAYRQPGPAPTD